MKWNAREALLVILGTAARMILGGGDYFWLLLFLWLCDLKWCQWKLTDLTISEFDMEEVWKPTKNINRLISVMNSSEKK